jgi:hypothetical protein
MRRPLVKLAPAVLAVLLLTAATAGCGRSSDDQTTTAPTTASPGTTTATGSSLPGSTTTATGSPGSTRPGTGTSLGPAGPSTTTSVPPDGDGGIDPMDDAATTPRTGTGTGTGVAFLESVRVARHEGYDRVVFQFRDHVPGYAVRYQDKPVRSDGPGEPVPLAGNFALVARMEPASGVNLGGTGPGGYEQTYTGPTRIDEGTPEITEVVETGDFEAVLTWAIGTRERVDFRTFTLAGPPRLVVDVRNH